MPSNSRVQPAVSPAATQPIESPNVIPVQAGVMMIMLPLAIVTSFLLYKQYRSLLLRRQIESLERVWLLKSSETQP